MTSIGDVSTTQLLKDTVHHKGGILVNLPFATEHRTQPPFKSNNEHTIKNLTDIPVEMVLLSPDAVSERWLTAPKDDVPLKNM